jgi:hypothetical protein
MYHKLWRSLLIAYGQSRPGGFLLMFHATVVIDLLIFIVPVPVTSIITLLVQEKPTSGLWNVA